NVSTVPGQETTSSPVSGGRNPRDRTRSSALHEHAAVLFGQTPQQRGSLTSACP
ncbi:MAG: hypothetical protein ACJA0V_004931, partial [Planctomycetota bacterium]